MEWQVHNGFAVDGFFSGKMIKYGNFDTMRCIFMRIYTDPVVALLCSASWVSSPLRPYVVFLADSRYYMRIFT